MVRVFEGEGDSDQFKRLLDEQNDWPSTFTFKFIVPVERFEELKALIGRHEIETRPSRKGNYVSVTLAPLMDSAESVIQMYTRVSAVEGLVAL